MKALENRPRDSRNGRIRALVLLTLLIAMVASLLWKLREEPSNPVEPAIANQVVALPVEVGDVMSRVEPAPPESTALPSPPLVTPSAYALHVRVFTRTGVPAQGASVIVRSFTAGGAIDPSAESAIPPIVTDERGEGSLTFEQAGEFVATCHWEGHYADARFDFSRDSVIYIDLMLRRAEEVRGRAVDINGKELADVSVSCMVQGEVIASTVSDTEGRFHFAEPLTLPATLRGELEGYPPVIVTHTEPNSDATLVFTRGGQLVVTVLDRDTRRPVQNFPLEIRGERLSALPAYQGSSDIKGEILLSGVTPGTYHLYSVSPDLTLSELRQPVSVALGEPTRIEVLTVPGGRIAGRVYDADTDTGVAGVKVLAMLQSDTTSSADMPTTGSDGRFEIGGLPGGRYMVGLMGVPRRYGGQQHQFAVSVSESMELAPGESRVDYDFALEPLGGFGGVVQFSDGAPAPGAKVTARVSQTDKASGGSWYVETVADEQGKFAVYDLPDAPIILMARWRGFESKVHGPTPPADLSADDVTLVMDERSVGTLAGRVVHADGTPAQARVSVVSTDDGGEFPFSFYETTDADGRFACLDVPAGEYDIRYGAAQEGTSSYTHVDGPFALQSGQSRTDIVLSLADSGLEISGVVLRADGTPAQGYGVSIYLGQEGGGIATRWTATADGQGRFVFQNLSPGAYNLVPYGGSEIIETWSMVVQAGEDVEVILPDVHNPDGEVESEEGAIAP